MISYLCSMLYSINERLAGRAGLDSPPWREEYLSDFHALPAAAEPATLLKE